VPAYRDAQRREYASSYAATAWRARQACARKSDVERVARTSCARVEIARTQFLLQELRAFTPAYASIIAAGATDKMSISRPGTREVRVLCRYCGVKQHARCAREVRIRGENERGSRFRAAGEARKEAVLRRQRKGRAIVRGRYFMFCARQAAVRARQCALRVAAIYRRYGRATGGRGAESDAQRITG